MNWTDLLLGLFGGGLVSGVAAIISSRGTAKKSEVEALRGIIDELRKDNVELRQEIEVLREENKTLRRQLGIKSDGRSPKGLALDR